MAHENFSDALEHINKVYTGCIDSLTPAEQVAYGIDEIKSKLPVSESTPLSDLLMLSRALDNLLGINPIPAAAKLIDSAQSDLDNADAWRAISNNLKAYEKKQGFTPSVKTYEALESLASPDKTK